MKLLAMIALFVALNNVSARPYKEFENRDEQRANLVRLCLLSKTFSLDSKLCSFLHGGASVAGLSQQTNKRFFSVDNIVRQPLKSQNDQQRYSGRHFKYGKQITATENGIYTTDGKVIDLNWLKVKEKKKQNNSEIHGLIASDIREEKITEQL